MIEAQAALQGGFRQALKPMDILQGWLADEVGETCPYPASFLIRGIWIELPGIVLYITCETLINEMANNKASLITSLWKRINEHYQEALCVAERASAYHLSGVGGKRGLQSHISQL